MSDFNTFMARLRKDPNDDVTRLVFADWLEEHPEVEGALFFAEELRKGLRHKDTDQSYHGSPHYECDHCGLSDRDYKNRPPVCSKALDPMYGRARAKEQEEKYEYERMCDAKKRWAYLRAQYGKEGDPE